MEKILKLRKKINKSRKSKTRKFFVKIAAALALASFGFLGGRYALKDPNSLLYNVRIGSFAANPNLEKKGNIAIVKPDFAGGYPTFLDGDTYSISEIYKKSLDSIGYDNVSVIKGFALSSGNLENLLEDYSLLIFPEQSTGYSNEIKPVVKVYLKNGGNILVMQNAGSYDKKGKEFRQNLFSEFTGIDPYTFDPNGKYIAQLMGLSSDLTDKERKDYPEFSLMRNIGNVWINQKIEDKSDRIILKGNGKALLTEKNYGKGRAFWSAFSLNQKDVNTFSWLDYVCASSNVVLFPEQKSDNAKSASSNGFEKGFVLLADTKDAYNSPTYHKSLKEMKKLGVDWVSIYAQNFQENVNSTNIYSGKETPTDSSLENIIRYIHEAGMHATLFPSISLQDPQGSWLGQIKPSNPDEWFDSYDKYIKHYAEVAQKSHAEQLVIGAELNSMQGMEYKKKWLDLIKDVRKEYNGSIVYSANFNAFESVSFWNKLDVFGMNFYFPLRGNYNHGEYDKQTWPQIKDVYVPPTYEELVGEWQKWVNTLDNWHKKTGKPILITELGYVNQQGTTFAPWSPYLGTANEEAGAKEQLLAYKAFVDVWAKKQIGGKNPNEDYVKGVYFYDWGNKKDPSDFSYVPSKKVKAVVGRWFGGQND